jgi:hypothetical protein
MFCRSADARTTRSIRSVDHSLKLQPIRLLPVRTRGKSIWALVVDRARLPVSLIPHAHTELQDWLVSSSQQVRSTSAKMWRSIVPLVWWWVWKERKDIQSYG